MKKHIIIVAVFTACLALCAAVWRRLKRSGKHPHRPNHPP